MEAAVIIIDPSNVLNQMDVQTGDVTSLQMLEFLKVLSQHFAKAICEEAKEIGVEIHNNEEFESYIQFLRKNNM